MAPLLSASHAIPVVFTLSSPFTSNVVCGALTPTPLATGPVVALSRISSVDPLQTVAGPFGPSASYTLLSVEQGSPGPAYAEEDIKSNNADKINLTRDIL